MAENRPPRRDGSDPAVREDDSVPRHRVVWEPPAAVAPVDIEPEAGRVARGTIRMVRPTLMGPHSIRSDVPPPSVVEGVVEGVIEGVVESVIEMPPTTDRVPGAPARPAPQSAMPQGTGAGYGPPPQSAVGYGPPPQGQPPGGHPLARTVAMVHSPPAPMAPRPASPTPPRLASRNVDPRLVLLREPDSSRAAAFRRLRDNVLTKGLPRVLAVSSPAKGDGKTSCAINLALALAEHTPARILLLDGNFTDPALAKIFSVDEHTPAAPDAVWLAPYKLAELTPCLHVAAIVARRGEPAPRYEKQRFDMLLDRLCRVGYDHIIVDAPAIEGSAMTAQLLGGVDGVLLAVSAGRTTARALRRALEEIPGNKALGVALVDAEPND